MNFVLRQPLMIQGLICLLVGAANLLAFAPFGAWPLQIISLAWLFHLSLLEHAAPLKRHFWRAWAFGLGWTGCGMYWLYITMYHYAHLPLWMASSAVFLLASFYLAPFTAIAICLSIYLRRRWSLSLLLTALCVLPALWGLTEWMRGWLLTGLPWVVSGYAHNTSPLAGFAPIVGVYGIGAIAALAAAALAAALLCAGQSSKPVQARVAALFATLFGLGALLQTIPWSQPLGKPISVRLLQGNVEQDTKFDPARRAESRALYQNFIEAEPADLIATPETALPLFIHQVPPEYLQRMQRYAQQNQSHIAIGLLIADGPALYTNSLIGISPQTDSLYRYNKSHLVPFGEFVPTGFHWFVTMLGIPMSDQTPGKPWQRAWQIKDQAVLPNICFDDLFGEEIAHHMGASEAAGAPTPSILLNVSNLAWFDDSLALAQHLQISQMRAIETARPMLRATNTGATAVILPDGKVQTQLPILVKDSIKAQVQGMQGKTPYVRFGNGIMLCAVSLALLLAWSRSQLIIGLTQKHHKCNSLQA